MRAPALQPPPPSALKRDPVPPLAELERLLGTSAAPERPGSLRERIVRWLDQEL